MDNARGEIDQDLWIIQLHIWKDAALAALLPSRPLSRYLSRIVALPWVEFHGQSWPQLFHSQNAIEISLCEGISRIVPSLVLGRGSPEDVADRQPELVQFRSQPFTEILMIGGNMEDEEAPGSPMRSYDALPIEISFSRAPQGSPSPRNNGRSYRPLLLSILALFVTLLLVDSMTTKHLEHLTIEFMNWVSAHPLLGVVAVTVVYALATILFVPGSVLTIGTGFAFRRASDSYGKALFLASLVSP